VSFLKLPSLIPHFSEFRIHRRHRCINNPHHLAQLKIGDSFYQNSPLLNQALSVGKLRYLLKTSFLISTGNSINDPSSRQDPILTCLHKFGLEVTEYLVKNRLEEKPSTYSQKMIGSETFIMVAFQVYENRTPWAFASSFGFL